MILYLKSKQWYVLLIADINVCGESGEQEQVVVNFGFFDFKIGDLVSFRREEGFAKSKVKFADRSSIIVCDIKFSGGQIIAHQRQKAVGLIADLSAYRE